MAHANGGADHADNYAFLMGSSFNRFIGNRFKEKEEGENRKEKKRKKIDIYIYIDRFDHINCYIVGRSKARKAVEISVQLTSYKVISFPLYLFIILKR